MKNSITIKAGVNKKHEFEKFGELKLFRGESVSILGETGSGKTALISDIELLVQGDSITRRKILIDDNEPSDLIRYNPMFKPIVMITQNTKCFSDMIIKDFLEIHGNARGITSESYIYDTIDMANQFTGENIEPNMRCTELSGGQTRSLLIADAIIIANTPVILLDEIENAGIDKHAVEKIIKSMGCLVCFVTHDPAIALKTDKRIILKNGSIEQVLEGRSEYEEILLERIIKADLFLSSVRKKMRVGKIK